MADLPYTKETYLADLKARLMPQPMIDRRQLLQKLLAIAASSKPAKQ